MTTILDGKKLADEIIEDLKLKVEKLNPKPTLAVILANDNSSSALYVSSKEKKCKELNFNSKIFKFDKNVKQDELVKLIKKLNEDNEIDAILVQLPLFNHLDKDELIELIDPMKDVDGFHPVNVGKLHSGLHPYAICCTPKGIIKLLCAYDIELSGKSAVVIGRSNIVGRPVAALLEQKNATVTLAHSKTKNLSEITKKADIIVCATGKINTLTKDMVKKDVVIVDVGITKNEKGEIKGDVDFENVKEYASYITPVPKGVGPMTIACLMENTYELYLKRRG